MFWVTFNAMLTDLTESGSQRIKSELLEVRSQYANVSSLELQYIAK